MWGGVHILPRALRTTVDILLDEAGSLAGLGKWHANIELWPQAGHDFMFGISQILKKQKQKKEKGLGTKRLEGAEHRDR